MPIPAWDGVGVLPPIHGDGTSTATRAPWQCTIVEFVRRFCTSEPRREILLGFLRYRAALRAAGVEGVQWLDGSFVENCEARRTDKRPPGDIDVVTVFDWPAAVDPKDSSAIAAFEAACAPLFGGPAVKPTFRCDAYPLALFEPPYLVARQAAFWVGLFSHAKGDGAHKGLCEVLLDGSDAEDKVATEYVTKWSAPDA